MVLWLLYLIFAVYFLLDAYHTELLLQCGLTELNVVLAWVIYHYGILSLWGIKLVFLVVLCILLILYQREKKQLWGQK